MIKNSLSVKFASSQSKSPGEAVNELLRQLKEDDPTVLFFFCSSSYDFDRLGVIVSEKLSCPVIGCTTAGEYSPIHGFSKDSIVAATLKSENLNVKNYLISELINFSLSQGKELKSQIEQDFSEEGNSVNNRFGLLLIDGLCGNEETVIGTLTASLSPLPIVGGSAGDNLRFEQTHVYHEGHFHTGAATLTIFETTHPFQVFQTKHFQPTETKLVITEANPSQRLVSEINGFPAAIEYARLIGVNRNELTSDAFSLCPVMLKIGGDYHVRSIQQVNEDDSLTFYCAIDKGLVMTIGQGKNILRETRSTLESLRNKIPSAKFTVGCDCILRRLELESKNQLGEVGDMLAKHNFLGFSTYGEQYKGVHVNQTLTGIMIGE